MDSFDFRLAPEKTQLQIKFGGEVVGELSHVGAPIDPDEWSKLDACEKPCDGESFDVLLEI